MNRESSALVFLAAAFVLAFAALTAFAPFAHATVYAAAGNGALTLRPGEHGPGAR